MASKIEKALECDGLNLVQNNGETAGQTVFHFHMHIIPRYKNDSVKLGWKPGKLSDAMREELLSAYCWTRAYPGFHQFSHTSPYLLNDTHIKDKVSSTVP